MSNRILVADDDVIFRKMLQGLLSDSGYKVVTASDGVTAWEILQANDPPRMAILDWCMPGFEGIEICRQLRQRQTLSPTYVILVSGRNSKADIVSGLQAGANDFITKPFHREELLARVRVGRSLTELQTYVQDLARYDSLTKLLNRQALTLEAEREWSRSIQCKRRLSCVICDIDYFKRVNDTHGHLVGDKVISYVAQILSEESRTGDVVARYGGEEFCAMLPDTNESEAAIWAERVRHRIAGLEFSEGGGMLHLTASFGVAERLENMTETNELIEAADQSLLIAKQSGRNRVFAASRLSGVMADLQATPLGIPGHISVAEIMTPVLATLPVQTSLFDAAQFLMDLRLDSAPVVDHDGRLIDFISEEEISRRLCGGVDWHTQLADCVSSKPVCFDVKSPASSVLTFLMRVSMRRIVVVDGTKPVGVVSRATLLRWLCNYAKNEEFRSAVLSETDRLAIANHDNNALRFLIEKMERLARELTCRIDGGVSLEPHEILISATQMQALCEDTLAYVSRSCSSNSQNVSLSSCLE